MHSSGKSSLAVGLSPYKIVKIDAFASKLAGRLFSPFCMARSVHKFFIKKINECYITNRTKVTRIHQKVINTPDRPVVLYIDDCIVGRRYDL